MCIRDSTKADIEIVPDGIPDPVFRRGAVATGGRADDHAVIISVNDGFGPRKNVQRLLEAHRALVRRGIECELHLVGHGYEPGGPCQRWAREKRVVEHVSFLGPLPHAEVLRRMRHATLLAHPSREESFGMTLVEAMSQRVPVIGGARSGAVPWVLGGGKAGLLVDVDDPRAVAGAMAAVLAQPALSGRLATNGYAHAWQNFRQSRVTDLYLDVYRRLLAEEVRK